MIYWNSFARALRSPADGAGGAPPSDGEAANTAAPADPPPDPAPADPPADPPTSEAPDLSFFGEDFVKDGQPDLEAIRGKWQDMLANETIAAEKAGQVPDDYDFKLPDDFDYGDLKPPEGVDIGLQLDDEAYAPVVDELKSFLKENGVPQEGATAMMGLLAKYKAAETSKIVAEQTDHYNKLGPTDAAREARLAKIDRALESRLPKDQAKAIQNLMGNIEAVRAVEALLGSNLGPRAPQSGPAARPVDPLAARYPNSSQK